MAKLNEIRQAAQQMLLRQQQQQQQQPQQEHQNHHKIERDMDQNLSSSFTTSREYDLQVDYGCYQPQL